MLKQLCFAASLIVIALGSAGCGDQPTQALSVDSGIASAPPQSSGARFEIRYLEGAIDDAQTAIDLANLCMERSVHTELDNFCLEIVSNRTSAIQTMQGMLQEWYGVTHAPIGDGTGRLGSLDSGDFEAAFLQKLIRLDTRSIRVAKRCVARADHALLIAFCVAMAEDEAAEIAQAQNWLCAWYGDCN